jgi:hypothetical protein
VPTTRIRLRPEQLGPTILASASQTSDAVQAGLMVAAERAVAKLKRATPVDRGMAKNAWQTRGTAKGGREVINTAPYIAILERGARPHPVSPEGWMSIFRWVLRHPELIGAGAGYVAKTRRVVNGAGGMTSRGRRLRPADAGVSAITEAATEITNAIVHKLRTHGQEALWMVRDNMPLFRKYVADEINRALVAYIRRGGSSGGKP